MAYLDEDRLYNNIEEKYKVATGEAREAYSDVLDTICEMPRADVVEVVRCKDCENRVKFDTNKFHCELTGYYCGEMGYCSDAVRKPQKEV